MDVDWSELVACDGYASAADVPKAIDALFSSDKNQRKKAYFKIDNYVVVQGGLFESAPYAARYIAEKIKTNPSNLNIEILNILFELANGCAGGKNVEHGPLIGGSIERLCRDAVSELLPILGTARADMSETERATIDALFEAYQEGQT